MGRRFDVLFGASSGQLPGAAVGLMSWDILRPMFSNLVKIMWPNLDIISSCRLEQPKLCHSIKHSDT